MIAKLRKTAMVLVLNSPFVFGLIDESLVGVSLAYFCVVTVLRVAVAAANLVPIWLPEAEFRAWRKRTPDFREPTSWRTWLVGAVLESLLLGLYGWPLLVLVTLPAQAAPPVSRLVLEWVGEGVDARATPKVRVPEGSVLYAPAREEVP